MRPKDSKNARRIATELRAMRRSLSALDQSIRRLAPILKAAASRNGHAAPGATSRRMTLTPKQRAALKLQGRYMGFIRQLTPREKQAVKRARAQRGIEAAIRKAERLARG